MNAITLLKQDHGNVEGLFARFEQLGDAATAEKATVRDHIVEQLGVHAVIEEQALYPAIRDRVPGAEKDVLEALEEHHFMKLALDELERLSPGHERFDAKMRVLIENVRHHVQEEEGDGGLFGVLREHFTVEELEDLGATLESLRKVSPNRPHPWVPDVPPFNLLLGPPVAVLDRVVTFGRNTVSGLLKRAS